MNDDKIERLIRELQEQRTYLEKQVRLTKFLTVLLAVLVISLSAMMALTGPKISKVLDKTDQIVQDLDEITDLDIATLNEAIGRLNQIVAPLANLFGK